MRVCGSSSSASSRFLTAPYVPTHLSSCARPKVTPTPPWKGPKGELGFYLVSDGGISPYRCKVRAPSFINLNPLREMLVGGKMGDLITTFGSVDIVLGEVDR